MPVTRKRIYTIAKELGITSKELIAKLEQMGMPGLKPANTVDAEEYSLIVNLYTEESAPTSEAPEAPPVQTAPEPSPTKQGAPRPPIVSVLGHIDHGKTTLLDAIRHTRVAAKEAGGITQGIGAYQAEIHGQRITFIDTPGHKAFTGMRARGAQATDIAVLVVAADDGVMAQTVEAINHIRAANIPMIVAINKVDKPNADVDKVMSDLAKQGLTPEEWGGDTITVPISALKGERIDELLEMILLVAEMEDIRADPNGPLEAIIIESHLSKGRGPVATVIVRDGTLHERDCIIAGSTYGRVKALIDEAGNRIHAAGPGEAVEILGLEEVPGVGTKIEVAKNLNEAKRKAEKRRAETTTPRRSRARMSVEELFLQEEEADKLQLIIKSASTGALEAMRREIEGVAADKVKIDFIHAGVGDITESDVLLAASVGGVCLIVGFGVKADAKALRLADQEGVIVLTYDIIYDLIEEIERVIRRMLGPEYEELMLGEAEVRNVFKVPAGIVAGCYVNSGKVVRGGKARVLRNEQEVHAGEIASLRRFDDDVREVQAGRECGIRLKEFNDIQVGDRIIVFTLEEVNR